MWRLVFRRLRVILIVAGAIGGGVASASAFMQAPGNDTSGGPDSVQPDGNGSRLGATAGDPAGGAAWAVRIYASRTGATCPEAGRISGQAFGRVSSDGHLITLDQEASGSCTDLSTAPIALAVNRYPALGEQGARAVIFGVVAPQVTALILDDSTGREGLDIRDGSFIAVREDARMRGASLEMTTDDGDVISYALAARNLP